MGPFVPEIIPEQLNLVVALFLGVGFGFVLEQAGFSSSRRLAGVFYGYDFTVLRVFFTAAVTAMSGVILLSYLGFLDIEAIFVNPLWLRPAIVGGIIMGLGFIVGGYCPGTSVCAASIGKVDAMFFVGGGLVGVTLFGELFPLYHRFFESTARGPVKVFGSLGVSQGLFAFLVIAMAVGAFYATSRIEKKVAGDQAPSQSFPVAKHLAAGAVLLVLGLVLMFMPDYKTRMVRKVSNPAYQAAHKVQTMVPDELAFRIVDQDPHTRILALRSAASFAALTLPGSVNLTQAELFGRDLGNGIAQRRNRKVIVADDDSQERQAYWLLQELGYENLAILEGGLPAFSRTFLQPAPFVPLGNRWDEDVRLFRQEAQSKIPKLIEAQKSNATKAPKQDKKIKGGC
jgi:rhodanese-related sulfurtransferase